MIDVTRRTALAAAAVTATLPARAPAAGIATTTGRALFGATSWTLPNGLRVVHVESRRVPVVAHYLFYGAGAGEDPASRSGLAHFLEHMMFKGSANVASGEISLIVAREGGQDNAYTSRDVTAYFQHVEASRLPLVMRLEADRFASALLPADELEAERAVVLEERRQRTDSNPRGRFYEAFEAALWGEQHWRGRPIIGWEADIRAYTRDDMTRFFADRYAPANAVLVVAGDATEATVRALADEYYGRVPGRPTIGRDRGPPPAVAAQPRLEIRDPEAREGLVMRHAVAPSLTWALPGMAPDRAAAAPWALEAVGHLLGGGQGSRLHKAVVETGLATAANCSYDAEVAGAGTFGISATLRPGIAPERLEAAIDAAVAALVQDGPTEAELARSIRQISAGALLALDGIGAAPRMLGTALSLGLPLAAVEFWPDRLRAVTLAEATEAARAVLAGTPSATGWMLPAA